MLARSVKEFLLPVAWEQAQEAACMRRQCREQRQGERHRQTAAERPTRAHVARRSRPRAHGDMPTVAIRGPL